MINDQTIEEIKNRMDIYEVVSDFVQLKKSGSGYKALSPFTDEKTPSFTVSPSRNIYKCFSTGKGGDAISFLMEIDGLSYLEALKYLAQKYAITIEEEEESDAYKESQSLRESLFIIMNFAKDHFVKNLWESDEGRNIGLSYFQERGFEDATIKAFDLGYSLDQWQGLKDAAVSGGYKEEFLEQAGLIIKKEDKVYDRFRGRVVFPIHNITGKVIAFGARTLKSNDKSPKYLNSPETELYTKSNILYGIFQAKNEIRNQSNCYLVEGYTDVVSMAQAGIKNVVASSGTSLTDDQIKLIKRYTENVTVLFDGDKAGIKASMRGIDMMLAGGLNVKAVPFPDGEDPDSYSRKLGGAAFKEYLVTESKDFISFKAGIYLDENPDPIKKAGSIREIVQSISLIPDPIKRIVYVQECSTLLGMEESTLVTEINKLLIQNRKDQLKSEPREVPMPLPDVRSDKKGVDRKSVIENQEREAIRMLMNYGDQLVEEDQEASMHLADYFLSESDDIDLTTEVYARIFQIFKDKLLQNEMVGLSFFLNHEDEDIRKVAIDLSTEKYELSPLWTDKYKIIVAHESDSLKTSAYTNILRLKFRIIQKMISDNMEKIKSSSTDSDIDEYLRIQGDLKEMEMSIAKILGNVTVK